MHQWHLVFIAWALPTEDALPQVGCSSGSIDLTVASREEMKMEKTMATGLLLGVVGELRWGSIPPFPAGP